MSSLNIFQASKKYFEQNRIQLSATPITTSTNDQAKEEAFALSQPLKVYLCDQQTKGRGRGTNEWLNSTPGSALLITFSLDVQSSPQPITAPLVGLKVYESLTKGLNIGGLSLKAPNDILRDGKKVAGILVETLKAGNSYRLVIGIGLNVYSHPTELPDSQALTEKTIQENTWIEFLGTLTASMKFASHECIATHFSDSERKNLLEALNLNPHLKQKFDSISPFGDLISATGTISWRDL